MTKRDKTKFEKWILLSSHKGCINAKELLSFILTNFKLQRNQIILGDGVFYTHGSSSRRNPKTTAITKSEVVTSSHAYIQLRAKGLNRLLLHTVILIDTLFSQLAKILFTLPVFWKTSFRVNILVLIATSKYYINALIRNTWKSKKLDLL
jgi:hypothetical protein